MRGLLEWIIGVMNAQARWWWCMKWQISSACCNGAALLRLVLKLGSQQQHAALDHGNSCSTAI